METINLTFIAKKNNKLDEINQIVGESFESTSSFVLDNNSNKPEMSIFTNLSITFFCI
jgi:hypothetical protein